MKKNKTNGNDKLQEQLLNMTRMLPMELVKPALNKAWKRKTKFLSKPKINIDQLKKQQSNQTKKIKYKNKKIYDWLEELKKTTKTTPQQQEFIKYYQTQYQYDSLDELLKIKTTKEVKK